MCKAPSECQAGPSDTQVEGDQALESRIEEALSCPCVQDLEDGPCGQVFVTAFSCYHRSQSVPKGCDCLQVNLVFADCLKHHPEALDGLSSAQKLQVKGSSKAGTSSSSSSSSSSAMSLRFGGPQQRAPAAAMA